MSMSSGIVCGFGFECCPTSEQLTEFVKLHAETFCGLGADEKAFYEKLITEVGLTDEDIDYFFETEVCNITDCVGYAERAGYGATVANIMRKETGIGFLFEPGQDDCESAPSVLFAEAMPWHYSEIEKSLTQEALEDICIKYMRELNIEGDPVYISVEYFG